eukprot:maker-scaffold1225_size54570-snap-gene-0.7 protein:Tk06438 transcript:maker-scaffold1225_size54570-snap-gene-0.7-mRNA-1 annotation:"hypothetical protein EAI_05055"
MSMLELRNAPLETNVSPATVVYGHQLRSSPPTMPRPIITFVDDNSLNHTSQWTHISSEVVG